ncbi:MAG TPA: proton-conducting transporter membrane subunit [Thermoanaerobaculia bacterium]|nr:proton-conducting transporter membrane subunit [Thermoanaerobaculia bacterium]
MLTIILLSIACLGATSFLSLFVGHSDRAALAVGTVGSALACLAGIAASLGALIGGEERSLRSAWPLPAGELHVALDALSSFFLVCVFLVSGLAAVYGGGYLRPYIGKRRLAPALFFFNLLVASMAVVAIARDGILFLVAWEVMSLTSFFLVTFESEREETRRAAMTYLIASQLGVILLFVLFALLGRGSGSYDFDILGTVSGRTTGITTVCFLLALVGFGTKAGFWPVHIWLPEAHPAAPSHVSALMSGVMIKMGIYGLLRTLAFLGPPPVWWGAVLIAIGAVSGVAGVVYALAQHDLKRLLAYHSVENIGIILLGIGVGLLGQSQGNAPVAFLGYAGGLLHVLNHGLFKGLLFQGAGSVLHGTGTRDIECLGGLYRRMPTTATMFLIGSVAICGLPPLNGFVSEWMIYVGAFRGGSTLPTGWAVWALASVPALALIGGLAAACFVKAFGVVFLGEPRTGAALDAHEAGWVMRAPMLLGALLCIAIGLWPAGAIRIVAPAAMFLGRMSGAIPNAGSLSAITRVGAVLLALVVLLGLLRLALLRGREFSQAATWGCGYAAPTTRMQYTAASFAQPILPLFGPMIHTRVDEQGPDGYFPEKAHYEEHLGDVAGERVLLPATRLVVRALSRLRPIQQGRLQLYLVYIAVTLVVLLVWQLTGVGR